MTTKTLKATDRKSERSIARFFLLGIKPRMVARLRQDRDIQVTVVSKKRGKNAAELASQLKNSIWICQSPPRMEEFLHQGSRILTQKKRVRKFGDLLMLNSPRPSFLSALQGSFRTVIGGIEGFTKLPPEEIFHVLSLPKDEARNLIIGGSVDDRTETIALTRGDFTTFTVPFSLFRPSDKTSPDFSRFSLIDYGQTIKLGEYEAATDMVLYETDPEYRKQLNAKRKQVEKGFGPSLRRVRLNKRLKRTDFPGVSPKTIARIERGETIDSHSSTLTKIAKRLGVSVGDIETF